MANIRLFIIMLVLLGASCADDIAPRGVTILDYIDPLARTGTAAPYWIEAESSDGTIKYYWFHDDIFISINSDVILSIHNLHGDFTCDTIAVGNQVYYATTVGAQCVPYLEEIQQP